MPILKKTAKFHVFDLSSESASRQAPSETVAKRTQYIISTGKRISIQDILHIAYGAYEVVLDEASVAKIDADIGALSGVRARYLGKASSVAASSLPHEYSKAALFLKIANGMQGKSGLSGETIRYLTKLLNDSEGPLFTSDETAGKELVDAVVSRNEHILTEIEALSIITSRFYLTGVASLLVAAASKVSVIMDPVSALSAEYFGADIESFDASNFETNRQHRGQISAATNLKMLLEGSKRLNSPISAAVSAQPSNNVVYKSIPQVNGSLQDMLSSAIKSLEIEINSIEEGPVNGSSALLFVPVPAQVALSTAISFLELSIEASNDRLLVIDQTAASVNFKALSNDPIARCTYLLQSAKDALVKELGFVLTYFEKFETSSSTVTVDDEEENDEKLDQSKANKKNMKPEADDSKLTPAQLAKVEAKRKAKAEKAAAKLAAKEAKKQMQSKAVILGNGSTQIRDFIQRAYKDNPSVSKLDILSNLLNPLTNESSPSLWSFTCKLLEELNAGASSKRRPKIAKGARDFTPDQMRIREQVFAVIRRAFKRHGGVEIDTPVFELKEVLTGKYGEDSKLIYDLADQGGELLSLRYDLTVPFARFLAMNSVGNIKRYHIAKVYRRDQPQPQRGRYREFYQCDFDIAGTYTPMVPDAEAITVVTEILSELPVGTFLVKLNHRKILDAIFEICGVPAEKFRPICSAVDKLDKLPWEDVKKEMVNDKGLLESVADKIGTFVLRTSQGKDPRLLVQEFVDGNMFEGHKAADAALQELILLFTYLEAMGSLQYVSFDLSLARGLDYYTGVIYEVVLTSGTSNVGSIAAGGRYDNLVGMFSSSGIQTPCVGISVGIERVFAIMEKRAEELNLLQKSIIQVYVASIGDGLLSRRMAIAKALWKANFACEFSYQPNPKFKKQLDETLERYIPFMVVFGDDELKKGVVKVKNMVTKTEVEIDANDVARYSDSAESAATDGESRLVAYLRSQGCVSIHTDTDLTMSK